MDEDDDDDVRRGVCGIVDASEDGDEEDTWGDGDEGGVGD